MANQITLKEWITRVGVEDVARLLKVNLSTVRHWARGYCPPKAEHMHLIKKFSKGAVSYESMIEREFLIRAKR
jgi:DNA-binding transcriptional regulator YdaS (Cro superfamily)